MKYWYCLGNHFTATFPQEQQQANEISESVQETEMVPGNTGEGTTAATSNMPKTLLETLGNKLEQLKQKAHTDTQANKEKFLIIKTSLKNLSKIRLRSKDPWLQYLMKGIM